MGASENPGTRLLLQNDRVRIWEHRVVAGETGPIHLHRRPYFSCVIRGSSGETIAEDGSVLGNFDFAPETVYWYGDEDLPETHALRNIGGDEMLIVTAELLYGKGPPPNQTPRRPERLPEPPASRPAPRAGPARTPRCLGRKRPLRLSFDDV
jgi:beta-alanine degradation protein BauB